jgi:hypothetical protein
MNQESLFTDKAGEGESETQDQICGVVTLPYNVEKFGLKKGAKLQILKEQKLNSEYLSVRTGDGRILMVEKTILDEMQKIERIHDSEPANDVLVIPKYDETNEIHLPRGLAKGTRLTLGESNESNLRKATTPEGIEFWITSDLIAAMRKSA